MSHKGARRDEANRQRSRDIATRLAANAVVMADTFDRAADLHEAIAADASHPLHEGSAERAAAERAFAATERATASWLLSTLGRSDHDPSGPARPVTAERGSEPDPRR